MASDKDIRRVIDWRLKWECLAKGFMNYLQDRFTAIEQRLERIEEERYGHQKD